MKVTPEHYEIMKNFAKKNVNIQLLPYLIRDLGSFERAISWTYIDAFARDWDTYCFNRDLHNEYEDCHLITAAKKIYRELAKEANVELQ